MSALRQDFVYALRSLRKQPGFTAVAIAMLAIGIGATVAIFALTFAVLYKPLPFPDPSRLILVHLLAPDPEAPGVSRQMIWSYPKYRVFRDHQQVFESSSTFTGWTWNLTGAGTPEQVVGQLVDGTYLPLLGVSPQLADRSRPKRRRRRVHRCDPFVFVLLAAVVLGVTLLAGYVPARRATRVDPLVTLRAE